MSTIICPTCGDEMIALDETFFRCPCGEELDIEQLDSFDPLLIEAELHADAELGWMYREVEAGAIPEVDYIEHYRHAVQQQYERLKQQSEEE